MARGFLSGMIIGTMAATVGAGGLSLAVGPPQVGAGSPQPVVESGVVPSRQQAPDNTDNTAEIAALSDSEQAQDRSEAPVVTAPSKADGLAVSSAETATAPAPDVLEEAGQEAAEAPTETEQPVIEATGDEPTPAQTPQAGLSAPETDSAAIVQDAPERASDEAPTEASAPVEERPEGLPDEEREEIVLTVEAEEPQGEQIAAVAAPKPASTGIGLPAKKLGSSSSTRLPSVQSNTSQGTDNSASSEAPVSEKATPMTRFAADFESTEGTPKMSIVLIDDGTGNIGVEALTTFPYPLSFAVDTSWKGAKDAMAVYRAAGFEVLAMVDLPRGARASDVEVAMPVLLAAVPEAVGVMETPDAGLQESRDVSGQVSEYLANSGHGLLLFSKGLNTVRKLAAKEGVPAATVFRDFDSKGQNASSIKRFLNHAALKAGTEGGVVMVGRLRADTISALLLWGLQDRSDKLQLTPISQLMKTQD